MESLPAELQCAVIRFLDPIGLISISQSSTHFRALIQPKRRHFVERLLALESLVDHGGVTPLFRSRDNNLDPDWTNAKWEAMRWACSGCLRLLPHRYFNNHALLQLRYRKPIPGSSAARPMTTWEPVGARTQSQVYPQYGGALSPRSYEGKKPRIAYRIYATTSPMSAWLGQPEMLVLLKKCNVTGFENMSQLEFEGLSPYEKVQLIDDYALDIEAERCGTKRHLRRCNECRYLRCELKLRPDGSGGTSKVPIMASRRVSFPTHLERYFPKFWENLESKRPLFNARLFRIYREDAFDQLWTMYMIRCPGCARWQESREFRFGGFYPHWKPVVSAENHEASRTWDDQEITESLLNELECNTCFEKSKGSSELSTVLFRWICRLIDLQLMLLSNQLSGGWSTMDSTAKRSMPLKVYKEIKHLIKQTPCLRGGSCDIIGYSDVALLKLRHSQCREIWRRAKLDENAEWDSSTTARWFDDRRSEFEVSEAHWKWLMAVKNELEENPEALAEWALGRKGDAFT